MFKRLIKYSVLVFLPLLFFVVSLLTLQDYGISWDEPIHFFRGQAYLNYFLSGDANYTNLLSNNNRSYYEDPSQSAAYFFLNDSGHPPVNDELAALSNYIFFQKTRILGDIESYHLFNITVSTLLVVVVVVFSYETYGLVASVVSGFALSTYPLFFSEGHFNIKDPAETAFSSLCIFAFWKSVTKNLNWKWLILSIVSFALALGTKFNVLFLPFILLPWLIFYFIKNREIFSVKKLIKSKLFILILILAPVIVAAIFFGTWPYLWQNPLNNLFNIVKYYVDIGTNGLGQPSYLLPKGFNIFPIYWISITTPPVVLVLTTLGIIYSLTKLKEKSYVLLLWLLWLLVPILRVSLPKTSIYGGIRQIMEFIPAMALLSGVGANWMVNIVVRHIKANRLFTAVLIILLFVPHIIFMVRLHPNENVYFNSLVGGLSGAQKNNVPYWGNSFGNAYLQAVNWLNKNASAGSKLALIQGTATNVPQLYIGPNISYSNSFWSGVNRKGEYLLELTHQGNQIAYLYVWDYVNTVLNPVYEVKVDGVAIAKIWKNDIEHSKNDYKNETNLPIKRITVDNGHLETELMNEYPLARIMVTFNPGQSIHCDPFKNGTVEISSDGTKWTTMEEKIPDIQTGKQPSLINNNLNYIFSAYKAKYVRISTLSPGSCLAVKPQVVIRGFK